MVLRIQLKTQEKISRIPKILMAFKITLVFNNQIKKRLKFIHKNNQKVFKSSLQAKKLKLLLSVYYRMWWKKTFATFFFFEKVFLVTFYSVGCSINDIFLLLFETILFKDLSEHVVSRDLARVGLIWIVFV